MPGRGRAGLAQPIHHFGFIQRLILCDVYENDLANVHLGESAEIRLNAYPDKVFTGRMSNVGPVLDPTLHTASAR